MMDAISDPSIETVVVMSSAQVGKTEILNNVIGFHIHQDPAPILLVQPTIEMAEVWSKDRLAPMLRDTPVLKGLVKDPRSRDSGNTLRQKTFPGGQIAMAGANSAASLSSRPVRLVLLDEVDRFPPSAGTEGDPVHLAIKRSTTFWNRKVILTSTPTTKGASRIEQAWEESDQRRFEVPCPVCGGYQTLKWAQVRWTKDPKGNPVGVHYECEHCRAQLAEPDKHRMVRNGRWVIARPWVKHTAGFHVNELYSPWSTWGNIVENFHEAKKRPETLRVWVNTSLGEPWEEEGVTVDDAALGGRREDYGIGDPLPEGVLLLTAGVDVQGDRIEATVWGFGIGEESWVVRHAVFRGNPETSLKVWRDLDDWLLTTWPCGSGTTLRIAAACVDSGGHATQQVYEFCRKRESRRIWPIIGRSGAGLPLLKLTPRRTRAKVVLGIVGTDTAKGLLFSRLGLSEFGPGYIHFPRDVDDEYFRQLTAEKLMTKHVKGVPTRVWKQIRARNEALDCAVYAFAAYASLNANLERIAQRVAQRAAQRMEAQGDKVAAEEMSDPENPGEIQAPAAPRLPHRPRGGWSPTRW
jgi:phage terminase large subunit GpA-like protein